MTTGLSLHRPCAVVAALGRLPRFRGKTRLAKYLTGTEQRRRSVIVRDCFGNRLAVPNTEEPVGLELAINGSYEPELVELLRERLAGGGDFLDVGANIGSFSMALAALCRKVVAIEASPAVLPFLRWNVEGASCRNISIVDSAVAEPGVSQVPFYVPPMDHFGMGSSAPQFGVEPALVPARTIDEVIRETALQPAAVKLDIEGYEASALLGAQEMLHSQSAPMIVMEFCDWAEERAFPGRKGFAQEVLMAAGYRLWTYPSFSSQSAPLATPCRDGFETIIGLKN